MFYVDNAIAFDAIKKYLSPLRDGDRIVLALELHEVLALTRPDLPELWAWKLDAPALQQLLKDELIGVPSAQFNQSATVDVSDWDCHDGTREVTGYHVSISYEIKENNP